MKDKDGKIVLRQPWYSYAMGTVCLVPDLMPNLPSIEEVLCEQGLHPRVAESLTKHDADEIRLFSEFLKQAKE